MTVFDIAMEVLAEHRMDDEARACTCGDWRWKPGACGMMETVGRPSVEHREHVAAVFAERFGGVVETLRTVGCYAASEQVRADCRAALALLDGEKQT